MTIMIKSYLTHLGVHQHAFMYMIYKGRTKRLMDHAETYTEGVWPLVSVKNMLIDTITQPDSHTTLVLLGNLDK